MLKPIKKMRVHNGMNSNPRGTYHVYFTYAVNALYLDINADRKSRTCKKDKRCNGSALSNSWIASSMNHLSLHLPEIMCKSAELLIKTYTIKG